MNNNATPKPQANVPRAANLKSDAARQTRAEAAQQLQRKLASLSFPALLALVRELLRRMGYTDVQMRRTQWKGRNSGGGWDMEAVFAQGLTRRTALIQVKRAVRPVQARCVDELRGAVIRAGAAQGMLFATGDFSPVARHAAGCSPAVETLLIDGQLLADLAAKCSLDAAPKELSLFNSGESLRVLPEPRPIMPAKRTGIRIKPAPANKKLALAERDSPSARTPAAPAPPQTAAAPSSMTVTVIVKKTHSADAREMRPTRIPRTSIDPQLGGGS